MLETVPLVPAPDRPTRVLEVERTSHDDAANIVEAAVMVMPCYRGKSSSLRQRQRKSSREAPRQPDRECCCADNCPETSRSYFHGGLYLYLFVGRALGLSRRVVPAVVACGTSSRSAPRPRSATERDGRRIDEHDCSYMTDH